MKYDEIFDMKTRKHYIPLALLSLLLVLLFSRPHTNVSAEEEVVAISSEPSLESPVEERLFLQVGIFSKEGNVESLARKLNENGIPVQVEPFQNRQGDLLHKVLVGPFSSENEALMEEEVVREITGVEPLIIRRGFPGITTEPVFLEPEKESSEVMVPESPLLPETPEQPAKEGTEELISGTRKPKSVESPASPGEKKETGISEKEKPPAPEKVEKKSPPKAPPVARRTDSKISLDFTDVDISVLIKFVSETTGKNFIYDEKVRGNITIISPKKITIEELYQVFLSVLQVKGFTTVEQGNIVKVIPSREAKQEGLKTFVKKDYEITDEFITQLIPLKFIDSKDASPLLTPMVSKEGLLTFYAPSNTLIIIDRGSNISRIARIISELDIDTAAQVIRLFQLENAPSDEVSRILSELYSSPGSPAARRPQAGRRTAAQAPAPTAFSGAKFISDPRTNSVLALAPAELMGEIEAMIKRLDIPAPENVGKVNVYYLENADAEQLATVLNNLISGTAVGGRPAAPPGQPATVKGIITPEFEGPIKITADKSTNSLLVIASPGDYLTLVEVLKKLDIKRRQVYVEAIIMEVELTKSSELGVEFRGAFEPTDNSAAIVGSNFNFTGNVNDLLLALAAGNPLLLAGEGLTTGVIGGTVILPDGTEIPSITAILRAALVSENVNVLSTPHLLTTDNEEAEIIVGENVPFLTSTARDTTNLSNIINTVEREDVGVTLRINPQIHESEFVKLDIFQEISAIKEGTTLIESSTIGPTTTKRSAKTNIIVKSGQTIILGGLMQERRTRVVSKIPLLGDIPLLGWLFRFESDNAQKTNLLIFLTPRIIRDTSELAGVTLKLKESMKDFIERNTQKIGGIDIEEYNKVLSPFSIDTD